MSREALRETIGFAAVVASLVFVGWEIRQNTAVASGEARQALAALQQDYLLTLAQDGELNEIFREWSSAEPRDLSPSEQDRGSNVMIAWLRQLELIYIQYEQGLADASVLDSYGIASPAAFSGPLFREAWTGWRSQFHPGFADFFEERTGLSSAGSG